MRKLKPPYFFKKKNILVSMLTLLIFLLYIFLSYHSLNKPFYVVDGDTVYKDALRFRFAHIDTPEIHGSQKSRFLSLIPNESCLALYGKVAKNYTSEHICSLIYLSFWKGRYGRYLSIPFEANGGSLEEDLVKRGLAFCYYREPILYLPFTWSCLSWENEAKNKKLGFWSCT